MTEQLLSELIVAVTPVLVPVLVALLAKVVGAIPSFLKPILAVLLGVGLDFLNQYLTGLPVGWGWSAVLGAAGVGVREVIDQTRKRLAS